MKDKNKRLMIVVGVLLLIVGVSFAYFVSSVLIGGSGAKTNMSTASINGATIEVRGTLSFSDLDIYPGHKTISGIEVTAIGDGEFIPYNLVWNGTNTLNTPLEFKVYKSDNEIEVSASCSKTTKVENGAQILAEECSITNIESLGSSIYSGTINKEQTKVVLSDAEFITASKEGNKAYYYVIIEYPNLNLEQNEDIGGTLNGKVTVEENNSTADIRIASIYVEENDGYKEVEIIPEGRYELNEEKSTCSNNAEPRWNEETNSLQVNRLTISGTECNIYFDKYIDTEIPVISNVTTSVTKTEINVTVTANDNIGVTEYWYQLNSNTPVKGTGNTHKFTGLTAGTTYTIKVYVKDEAGNQSDTTTKSAQTTPNGQTSDTILAGITVKTGTPTFSIIATTDKGVYKVSDPVYGGYSYYWRGAVTNNYVKFANKCWRIVRINGDKTMRLIYDGATCHANGTSTEDSIAVASTAYNTSYNQSNYVGWTYTGTSQRTLSGTASNAKTQLESWYNSNIGNNTTYSSKVADGKYCNDRNAASGYTWSINGSNFYYAAYNRINTGAPTLACNSGDIYTLKVGLITADEVIYAGGKNTNNTSYYLYNEQVYWTMSPANYGIYGVGVLVVNSSGYLNNGYTDSVSSTFGLRPVINLKADTLFAAGGNGTLNNPYVVA